MVQRVISKRITILQLSYFYKTLYLAKINGSVRRKCEDNKTLQHFRYSPMEYSEIICFKCFNVIEEEDEIFRKYACVGGLKGSKYMHLHCAKRYNYV